MRQLSFIKPGVLEWHDVPRPRLAADTDAIVRPIVVARCDLDLCIATGTGTGPRVFPGPFAFGHEAIAVVTDAGDAAGVVPGEMVVVPFQLSCGRCDHCRRGFTNSCSAYPPRAAFGLKPSSGTEFGGAVSEAMRVPFADHMLIKVPHGVDPLGIASMADNLPDAWRAVAPQLAAWPEARVLVLGGWGQSIGLYAAGLAASLGAGAVLYLDDDLQRRTIAEKMGARAEVLALSDRDAADKFEIVVDASGNQEALRFAIASTAPNGALTVVSMYFGEATPLPLERMYAKSMSFTNARIHARMQIPPALAHCATGWFHADAVTSRVVPFSEAPQGFLDPGPKIVFQNDWAI
jgi:threonine dehydrogenase-like Zn-dependent dehydrogenase